MKVHTTNYVNTLIEVAEDCPVAAGVMPPLIGDQKSVVNLQFEIINDQPYIYTSDDVLFRVFALRKGLSKDELDEARTKFFSKGQPCFRASPLCKRYGFGVHSDAEGKLALFGMETDQYKDLIINSQIAKVKAMRSKRA
ncbi:hypothetical protein G3O08_02310 [Cryomorpha ignava]|uniref:Uncharacterized protein n=1 Tax=Cryomorpha ignava TaxID=101383 RepID=A0A7K3WNQ3_9FLAO|nr:DUF6157 family protein [Cryomorpha ignava]NEN22335.1 hypothetical protein [Cryomorpha ignava]